MFTTLRIATRLLCPMRNYRVGVRDIKKGMIVNTRNRLWAISDFALHTQGRQGSHIKVELVPFGGGGGGGVSGGGKVVARMAPDDYFDALEIKTRACQFLYESEGLLHFLDLDSMDEISCSADLLEGGERVVKMLNDSMDISIQCVDDETAEVVSVKLPLTSVYRVAIAPPAASIITNEGKGTRFKHATLENGVNVVVPEFVMQGESIVVSLADFKYRERVKASQQ
ncbi:hypothetical protein CcCBS67573_g02897 [Chytriomyces confervae]|uniref:Elongation factor P n=1 Tax=Chytriomyces confervae TaxID=246404 RepID=A0A507FHR3_9FUNG|nr:hypothetical protein CcCBS67573_g02897 [Chytriomyces confervae]